MNFFEQSCQEAPLNNTLFGLCDDQDGGKAYTDQHNPEKWIATVKNNNSKTLVFTAIDKCVIKDTEEAGRGRCDGMLTSDEHLYFIELKDKNKGAFTEAIEQLASTIQFFKAHHDDSIFKHKKAYVCNKRRGHFQEIDNEQNLRFFRQYGFRMDAQAEIVIV
jgi:hypothetical protein